MKFIGLDLGSTAAKLAVFDNEKKNILVTRAVPEGWNAKDTAEELRKWYTDQGYAEPHEPRVVATGYGRISVPFADKVVTEISCHAKGASFLQPGNFTVVDIGGQDTKVIVVENGMVTDFVMNDKCSAGTGKFLEIMSNRLGVTLDEMLHLASKGSDELQISSMCTVFAESEVISLIGKGTSKEDIASAVVNSIINKVKSLVSRKPYSEIYFLSGGFAGNAYIQKKLAAALGSEVISKPEARFCGAIGAALLG